MKVLLDTHALLWAGLEPWKLPQAVSGLLEDRETEVFVSAASALEIATKFRIGKLPGAEGFVNDFRKRLEILGFLSLSVSVEHGQRAGLLPGKHKIPSTGC